MSHLWNHAAIDAAPNDASRVPGAVEEYNHINAIEQAIANLPAAFARAVSDQHERGEKVIYYLGAIQVVGSDGAIRLEAMAKVIEHYSQTRTYIHFDVKTGKYRIGPILDEADKKEVRGLLVLGRQNDAFTDDASGDFFRGSGVPAAFSTSHGTGPTPIPTKASYKTAPFVKKSGKVVKTTSKPRNAWIAYRASRHHAVKKLNPGLHTSHISGIVKFEWQTMDDKVKTLWYELSRNERMLHGQNYPDYRLEPRKPEAIKRRRPAGRTIVDAGTFASSTSSVDVDAAS